MDYKAERQRLFALRAALNKPLADAPGAAAEGRPDRELLPAWARHALRRKEDVPGRVMPMWVRWYDVCPICHRLCFLVHPWVMPAFEEILEEGQASDLETLGRQSLDDPMNLIRVHPCQFFNLKPIPWDFSEEKLINLKDYV